MINLQDNIAVDGPAGAGKSTIARLLAKEINYQYLDTGAMYRAICYLARKKQIDIHDEKAVTQLMKDIDLKIKFEGSQNIVILNGEDVTNKIRANTISKNVSIIAAMPTVRTKMVELQQKIASKGKIVMEGRDIGTVVLPKAKYKFYLDASNKERAKRRYKELKEKGDNIELEQLEEEIKKRDYIDSNRKIAPLKRAKDAVYIDTTGMNIKQVVQKIKSYIK